MGRGPVQEGYEEETTPRQANEDESYVRYHSRVFQFHWKEGKKEESITVVAVQYSSSGACNVKREQTEFVKGTLFVMRLLKVAYQLTMPFCYTTKEELGTDMSRV